MSHKGGWRSGSVCKDMKWVHNPSCFVTLRVCQPNWDSTRIRYCGHKTGFVRRARAPFPYIFRWAVVLEIGVSPNKRGRGTISHSSQRKNSIKEWPNYSGVQSLQTNGGMGFEEVGHSASEKKDSDGKRSWCTVSGSQLRRRNSLPGQSHCFRKSLGAPIAPKRYGFKYKIRPKVFQSFLPCCLV